MIPKDELRKIYKAKRAALTESEIALGSKKILTHLVEFFEFEKKTVHCFLPIANKQEVDTWPILHYLFNLDCRVCTSITHTNLDQLSHTQVFSDSDYEVSTFGVPCPKKITPIAPSEIDIVLVPALYIDKMGNRLGYGKGYYDRFLNLCVKDCLFIGLTLFEPNTIIVESASWDIGMHYCVTMQKSYAF